MLENSDTFYRMQVLVVLSLALAYFSSVFAKFEINRKNFLFNLGIMLVSSFFLIPEYQYIATLLLGADRLVQLGTWMYLIYPTMAVLLSFIIYGLIFLLELGIKYFDIFVSKLSLTFNERRPKNIKMIN
jgi:hypothetical protein